jgi:hypothetical protein
VDVEKKKQKIYRLANDHPNMKRSQIAALIPCTPAFVTQTLGAKKPYKPRQATQTTEPVAEGQ